MSAMAPRCSVVGCERSYNAKGYCDAHYWRFRKHGNALADKPVRMVDQPCRVDGCDRRGNRSGLCHAHNERQRRGSSLSARIRDRALNRLEWALARTERSSECWIFKGPVNSEGYGPHRIVYEGLVGPIPAGLQLDHLCRVRHCVNPAHLEPVTPAENIRRSDTGAVTRLRWQKFRAARA